MKPTDRRFKLRKFAAELLEQRCLALLHGHELLFHELHARKQAVLHRLDGRSHVGESCLELALESLLIGTESLKVTVEDASHIVIDLEQFVLQSFKTIGLAVGDLNRPLPCDSVELVLTAEVADKLRHLNECHGSVGVLLPDNLRLCSTDW